MVRIVGRSALRTIVAAPLFLFVCASSPVAFCQDSTDGSNSTLRKFEKSVQPPAAKPDAQKPAPQHTNDQNKHDDDDSWFNDILHALFTSDSNAQDERTPDERTNLTLADPTMERLNPRTEISLRRDDGDILIPFVRYDVAYQNISSNIDAVSNRLEAGYGTYALLFENYLFRERVPSDTLTLNRAMLLYRISESRTTEFDFGIGQTVVMGAQSTPLNSISVPIKLLFGENQYLKLEFRPTWASRMDDYELALLWGKPFWSAKIGYRSLNSPGVSLHGPFAGFALYY